VVEVQCKKDRYRNDQQQAEENTFHVHPASNAAPRLDPEPAAQPEQ
jgi:hypothetical protein